MLVCVCCLTSCAKVEQEIGKAISVAAVDAVAAELDNGYVNVNRKWKKGDKVTVSLEMTPRVIRANSKVVEDNGKVVDYKIVYNDDFLKQMLEYGAKYSFE